MARPLRIEYAGATYLLIGRAEKRRKIFRDDEDRNEFLSILKHQINRYDWICHAYVLLDGEYMLVLETPKGELTRGMRQLNGVYTQYSNRKYKKKGSVFHGRYRSIVMQQDKYLLDVCQYLALAPKRVLSEPIHRYKWSSYRATAGLVKQPDFLSVKPLRSQFAKQEKRAIEKYRAFIKEGEKNKTSPLDEVRHQILLGDDAFVKKMLPCLSNYNAAKRLSAGSKKKVKHPSLAQLFKGVNKLSRDERNDLICRAHLECGYTLAAISKKTGLHFTTISKIVNTAAS